MKMTGQQLKERLERDLGFEANRARMLTEAFASDEVATYWKGRGLEVLDVQSYASLAKTALIAGFAGRQKLTDLLYKLIPTPAKGIDISEVATEIVALVLDHQATLNLSRHRASCVNAHLNVLEPDRSLTQIYSSHLDEPGLKRAKKVSNDLLKKEVASQNQFTTWLRDVHKLLCEISDESPNKSEVENESDSDGSRTRKGLISRKALSTYSKQWELFAKEKLGPTFGLTLEEDDASPLSGKLNRLENGSFRSWTTIIGDITEVRTSSVFQKRVSTPTERTLSISNQAKNLDSIELDLGGRPLKIQMSSEGVDKEQVAQFVKAMKAQFLVYSGKGAFNVSINSSGKMITVSLLNATKGELKKLEEVLLQLI